MASRKSAPREVKKNSSRKSRNLNVDVFEGRAGWRSFGWKGYAKQNDFKRGSSRKNIKELKHERAAEMEPIKESDGPVFIETVN